MRIRGLKAGQVIAVAVVAAGLSSCGSGNAAGAQSRTVQVDHKYDQFATVMRAYFPRVVTVRPGDTITFKQTWTGEPHSVTLGTSVQKPMDAAAKLLDDIAAGKAGVPDQAPPGAEAFDDGTLPSFFGQNGITQAAAQPCYLDSALPPRGETEACARRAQPAFDGRQSYYSSGAIPYDGLNGNTYKMKLADDLKPGRYRYYCNVHSPLMNGIIDVKAKGASIPSQGEVDRRAQSEIDKVLAPAVKVVNDVKAGRGEYKGVGNLAGAGASNDIFAYNINEFFPRTINAKVNEKVTWTMSGTHTISFNAPKYFPIVTFAKNGTVTVNDKTDRPAGWTMPEPANRGGPPAPPRTVDVGKWDGKGFHSTGTVLGTGDRLIVTFTNPGTYLYACLIHPPMVGKVVVK